MAEKMLQMERAFSMRKFRLGILDYLSRNFVFPWKFPFGKKKIVFPFTFHPKFTDFLNYENLCCLFKNLSVL